LTGLSRIDVDVGSGDVALRQVGRVEGDVGSGDLVVDGATAVAVDVGSGDAVLKRVQGDVRASVGSGDVDMLDVGPIASLSAGSGSISVEGVRGDARIASVGSGDIALRANDGAIRTSEAAAQWRTEGAGFDADLDWALINRRFDVNVATGEITGARLNAADNQIHGLFNGQVLRITRRGDGFEREDLGPATFVPLLQGLS
jgi:hypothetical protein